MKLSVEKTINKEGNTIVKEINEIETAKDFGDIMLECYNIKDDSDVTRVLVYLILRKLFLPTIIAVVGVLFFKEEILNSVDGLIIWLMNFWK